jgi:hypothetical protein
VTKMADRCVMSPVEEEGMEPGHELVHFDK